MSDHPLIERARTSPVPVAPLIGFSIEPLGHVGESSTEADATTAAANALATTGLNEVSHIGSLSDS